MSNLGRAACQARGCSSTHPPSGKNSPHTITIAIVAVIIAMIIVVSIVMAIIFIGVWDLYWFRV